MLVWWKLFIRPINNNGEKLSGVRSFSPDLKQKLQSTSSEAAYLFLCQKKGLMLQGLPLFPGYGRHSCCLQTVLCMHLLQIIPLAVVAATSPEDPSFHLTMA